MLLGSLKSLSRTYKAVSFLRKAAPPQLTKISYVNYMLVSVNYIAAAPTGSIM